MLYGKKRNVNEIVIDKWMLIGFCFKMLFIVWLNNLNILFLEVVM